MKVCLNKRYAGPKGNFAAGCVIDVSDGEAKQLIDVGAADAVESLPKFVSESEAEAKAKEEAKAKAAEEKAKAKEEAKAKAAEEKAKAKEEAKAKRETAEKKETTETAEA